MSLHRTSSQRTRVAARTGSTRTRSASRSLARWRSPLHRGARAFAAPRWFGRRQTQLSRDQHRGDLKRLDPACEQRVLRTSSRELRQDLLALADRRPDRPEGLLQVFFRELLGLLATELIVQEPGSADPPLESAPLFRPFVAQGCTDRGRSFCHAAARADSCSRAQATVSATCVSIGVGVRSNRARNLVSSRTYGISNW